MQNRNNNHCYKQYSQKVETKVQNASNNIDSDNEKHYISYVDVYDMWIREESKNTSSSILDANNHELNLVNQNNNHYYKQYSQKVKTKVQNANNNIDSDNEKHYISYIDVYDMWIREESKSTPSSILDANNHELNLVNQNGTQKLSMQSSKTLYRNKVSSNSTPFTYNYGITDKHRVIEKHSSVSDNKVVCEKCVLVKMYKHTNKHTNKVYNKWYNSDNKAPNLFFERLYNLEENKSDICNKKAFDKHGRKKGFKYENCINRDYTISNKDKPCKYPKEPTFANNNIEKNYTNNDQYIYQRDEVCFDENTMDNKVLGMNDIADQF